MGVLKKRFGPAMRAAAFTVIMPLTFAACGNAGTSSNSKAGPSIFDASLASDAALLNGTGFNPNASSATAPVAGGCLVRVTNITGNDINCSNAGLYKHQESCRLNPYSGYANFLVAGCPASNLIGSCFYGDQTMYYYQGYLIVSPNTPVNVLSASCTAAGGIWH